MPQSELWVWTAEQFASFPNSGCHQQIDRLITLQACLPWFQDNSASRVTSASYSWRVSLGFWLRYLHFTWCTCFRCTLPNRNFIWSLIFFSPFVLHRWWLRSYWASARKEITQAICLLFVRSSVSFSNSLKSKDGILNCKTDAMQATSAFNFLSLNTDSFNCSPNSRLRFYILSRVGFSSAIFVVDYIGHFCLLRFSKFVPNCLYQSFEPYQKTCICLLSKR